MTVQFSPSGSDTRSSENNSHVRSPSTYQICRPACFLPFGYVLLKRDPFLYSGKAPGLLLCCEAQDLPSLGIKHLLQSLEVYRSLNSPKPRRKTQDVGRWPGSLPQRHWCPAVLRGPASQSWGVGPETQGPRSSRSSDDTKKVDFKPGPPPRQLGCHTGISAFPRAFLHAKPLQSCPGSL